MEQFVDVVVVVDVVVGVVDVVVVVMRLINASSRTKAD